MNKKSYSEWTAEEKAQYKAKKAAYLLKRSEDTAKSFELLESELKKLNASPKVFELVEKCKSRGKGGASNRETYMSIIFGNENPAPNTKVSYLFIGIRGPNGERLKQGESIREFVTRVGDVNYKYDANTISSMVWYLNRRGYTVTNDKNAATVTFVK